MDQKTGLTGLTGLFPVTWKKSWFHFDIGKGGIKPVKPVKPVAGCARMAA
jgi:hypothetical protein